MSNVLTWKIHVLENLANLLLTHSKGNGQMLLYSRKWDFWNHILYWVFSYLWLSLLFISMPFVIINRIPTAMER